MGCSSRSVQRLLAKTGGITPRVTGQPARRLLLAEPEEISRGLFTGIGACDRGSHSVSTINVQLRDRRARRLGAVSGCGTPRSEPSSRLTGRRSRRRRAVPVSDRSGSSSPRTAHSGRIRRSPKLHREATRGRPHIGVDHRRLTRSGPRAGSGHLRPMRRTSRRTRPPSTSRSNRFNLAIGTRSVRRRSAITCSTAPARSSLPAARSGPTSGV